MSHKRKCPRLFVLFSAISIFLISCSSLSTESLEEQKAACSVEYLTFKYDDRYVTTMDIDEDHSVTIYFRGNRYALQLDTVGIYKFSISEDEYSQICSMLDTKKFRKRRDPKSFALNHAYSSITFTQAGQSITKEAFDGPQPTPYMGNVYGFFGTMLDENIKSRQPYVGLSSSVENVKTDVNGRIQFTVAIINKGEISFSIPAFGTKGFFMGLSITGDTRLRLDKKHVSGLSPASKDNSVLLHPGEQYNIDYSVDKFELPAGYNGTSIELSLPLTFETDKESHRFLLIVMKDF